MSLLFLPVARKRQGGSGLAVEGGPNRARLVRVALCFTVIRSTAEIGSRGSAMKFYNRDEFIWTAKLGLC